MYVVKSVAKTVLLNVNDLICKTYIKLLCDKQDINPEFVFIESAQIGDFIIKLPFYLELINKYSQKKKTILTTSKILLPLIRLLLPSFSFRLIDIRNFIYNPIYRYKFLSSFPKCEKVVVSSPFRPAYHIFLARWLCAQEKYIYSGEKIHLEDTTYKFDSYFTVIKNPFILEKRNIDAHIYRHISTFLSQVFSIEVNNTREAFSNILKKFKKRCSNYIVILTDASHSYRLYNPDNWQIILNNLPKNLKIIQLGLNKFPLQHPNLIDLTGKTSLEEAMVIIINASLVIGVETGLTHLAYLSGVPTVCILGGGHFGRFLPWPEFEDIVKCVYKPMDCFQCGWKCKYGNLQKGEVPPCILQIPPESVLKAIEKLNKEYKFFR